MSVTPKAMGLSGQGVSSLESTAVVTMAGLAQRIFATPVGTGLQARAVKTTITVLAMMEERVPSIPAFQVMPQRTPSPVVLTTIRIVPAMMVQRVRSTPATQRIRQLKMAA